MALIGGEAHPVKGLHRVLRHSASKELRGRQQELSPGVALFSRLAVPRSGLHRIGRSAAAAGEHGAQAALGGG